MDQLKLEYPLEVKVVKALGWTDFIQDKDEGFWWGTPPPSKTTPDPRPCPVPDYPNDPGEAIKAAMEIARMGYNVAIEIESPDGGGQFACSVGSFFNVWRRKSLPYAICLAIVEAAGGER